MWTIWCGAPLINTLGGVIWAAANLQPDSVGGTTISIVNNVVATFASAAVLLTFYPPGFYRSRIEQAAERKVMSEAKKRQTA